MENILKLLCLELLRFLFLVLCLETIYNLLVGQHSIARDFYYQLSLLLSVCVFLFLFLSLSISLSLHLSPPRPPSPLLPDKKLPALDPSLATSHLYEVWWLRFRTKFLPLLPNPGWTRTFIFQIGAYSNGLNLCRYVQSLFF
jgi:hypothetical protein